MGKGLLTLAGGAALGYYGMKNRKKKDADTASGAPRSVQDQLDDGSPDVQKELLQTSAPVAASSDYAGSDKDAGMANGGMVTSHGDFHYGKKR